MNYNTRRAIALSNARDTPGFDRVVSPEREADPQMPYNRMSLKTGECHVMSRQERRARDKEEAKEPVLSSNLTGALKRMDSNNDALIIWHRHYTPAPTGNCYEPMTIKKKELNEAILSLSIAPLLVGLVPPR